MLLQDLYRVTTFKMRVDVFIENSVHPWLYSGLLDDIPETLLNCQIKVISAYEKNCLLITVAQP
jgi:hypothetical protein